MKPPLRVISGTAKGTKLDYPDNARPITDRAKTTLFDVIGPDIVDKRVLDIYAGSGSLGIEALSRGAAKATFVDFDNEAIIIIKQNLAKAGLLEKADIIRTKALQYMEDQEANSFDIVFADPPFEFYKQSRQRIVGLLEKIVEIIPSGGAIILKYPRDLKMPEIEQLIVADTKEFGASTVTIWVKNKK